MEEAKVYVSLDGKEWILAGEGKDLENNDKRKTITLQESMPAKYVKIEAVHTYGNDEGQDKYVSGINFSYYEDLTKEYKEPYIEYSSIELTNQDIVAKLHLSEGVSALGGTEHTLLNGDESGNDVFEKNEE